MNSTNDVSDAVLYFDKINDSNSTGFSSSQDGSFGRELESLLMKDGWKMHDTLSRCSVASFESHLQKNGAEVDIIVSSFMGVFTEVRFRPAKTPGRGYMI